MTQSRGKNIPPNKGRENVKNLKSGQVTSLPWENDDLFLDFMEEHRDMVLMAGFQTVFTNPFMGENDNVQLGASILSEKILQPGEVFSQNQVVGPYDESKGFKEGPTYVGNKLIATTGGGVCKIASTLYNVAVLSNLQIIERYNHSVAVPYVPYGQDATISYGAKDIRFKNNTSFPILIWAQGIDNTLYMAFYGKEKPPKVNWHHDISNVKKATTIYRKNPELSPCVERVVVKGMDGATVKSQITIIRSDGTKEKKTMNSSYYKPLANIIERAD
ncbi:MAG TPA: VanW family protein [Clostridia bacterium]|nr:VanW family protein [Clostridia bacterium]